MMQSVVDVFGQNLIFALLLALGLLGTLRPVREKLGFSIRVTNEVKGLAILMIIFGHVGFFLFSDPGFLSPLSTVSGIGVDIFFLLSGYGLAASALRKNYSRRQFYQRRAGKIFIPLWLVLAVFLILDAVFLGRFYDWMVVIKSFLGFFPSADIYQDLNSPLWYLTPLLFYYLLFPWGFRARRGVLSAVVIALVAYVFILLPWPINERVRDLYEEHFLAFPVGVALAAVSDGVGGLALKIKEKFKSRRAWIVVRYLLLVVLFFGFLYLVRGAVGGKWLAQIVSILSAIMALLFFILLKLRVGLLELLGEYSYELYLLHWPLMYRYDFIFAAFPVGLGMALYIVYLLFFAYLLRKAVRGLSKA